MLITDFKHSIKMIIQHYLLVFMHFMMWNLILKAVLPRLTPLSYIRYKNEIKEIQEQLNCKDFKLILKKIDFYRINIIKIFSNLEFN